MKKVTYKCDKCGSNDLVWDAYSGWDATHQRMELVNAFDDCHCKNCDAECNQVEVILPDTANEDDRYFDNDEFPDNMCEQLEPEDNS